MIDERNFFDQPIKENDLKKYDNIQKIATGQGDYYTTGCLIDFPYFEKHYKLIELDIKTQEALDADPKALQEINFTGNISRAEGEVVSFVIEQAKETVLDFSKGTMRVLQFYFILI